MSDDTPDTHVDNAEPSMEDILASIRRIIADEDGEAFVKDSVIAPPASIAELDTTRPQGVEVSQDVETVDLEMSEIEAEHSDDDDSLSLVDLVEEDAVSDIDILLSDLDKGDDFDAEQAAPEAPADKLKSFGAAAAASIGALASAGIATANSLTEARSNPKPEPLLNPLIDEDNGSEALELMLDSNDILSDIDSDVELDEILQIPDANTELPAGRDDDIEALLGDMLSEDDDMDVISDEMIVDPAADMIDDYEAQSTDGLSDELLADLLGDDGDMPETPQSTSDLDLVKSLMADLTDDPYDASETEAVDEEADMLDEILSLSMDDEMELHGESGEIDDVNDVTKVSDAYVIEINDDLLTEHANVVEPSSTLAQIAQAAEAEAESVERRTGVGAAGLGAAGFALGAGLMQTQAGTQKGEVKDDLDLQEAEAIVAEIDNMSLDDTSDVDLESGTITAGAPQDITPTQETADMPKAAAQKEKIIDTVTEEATAGAFASLSQVVENNAVVEERGDRIGDLVQEALRPMLKEWLDKNLKGIVERAVTKEVKRISSGK